MAPTAATHFAYSSNMGVHNYPIRPTLIGLPQEILELIAFYCANNALPAIFPQSRNSDAYDDGLDRQAESSTTPPFSLSSFIRTNRRLYSILNANTNQRLYAKVFRDRFDTDAIERRFGSKAVSASNLALELKRRCVILKRIRRSVSLGRLFPDGQTEDSRIEMEENLWLAFMMVVENDGKNMQQLRWAHIDDYIKLHHTQDMLEAAFRPEYPQNTPDRALALQLSYLLCDPDRLESETQDESDEKLFVLRPFVFAAHRFDAFHAPWTTRRVPYTDSDAHVMDLDTNPSSVDGSMRPEVRSFIYCGQEITICPPNATQAACFNFFMKVERDPAVTGINDLDTEDVQETMLGRLKGSSEEPTSSRNPLNFTSIDHDRDIRRLLLCTSPARSPGLNTFYHMGQFEGSWEGRFTYFDFDSYRDMLGGKLRSLYEGHFGEQPQVWKIKEHLIKLRPGEFPGGSGDTLNAGYFPDNDEPTMRENLSLQDARTFVQSRQRANGTLPHDWHSYPRFDDEEKSDVTAMDDEDRYEILLSGTGHSAWGRFLLRGRIRSWDGMFIMAKEYRPDGRGRWLYRGYVVAGGRLVGRWRDTFTPIHMSGYEGCFLLHRRSQ